MLLAVLVSVVRLGGPLLNQHRQCLPLQNNQKPKQFRLCLSKLSFKNLHNLPQQKLSVIKHPLCPKK